MRIKADARGMLLVEALLGLGVISIVLLILVTFFSKSVGALTQFRVKKEVNGYAKAEIEHWQAMARIGEPGTPPVASGYNNLLAPTANPVEHNAVYPDALMGSVPATFSKERMNLLRTVTITVANQGLADEYKTVTIRLRDTQSPERFAPVTMQTEIRKPDPSSLDLRESAGSMASLSLQLQEQGGAIIPSACMPQVDLTGPQGAQQPLDPPGNTVFPFLPVGTYAATFSADRGTCSPGYWPRTISGIGLSEGPNAPANLNPVQLQRVKQATASIWVVNKDDQDIQDANVVAEAPNMPNVPGYNGGAHWAGPTGSNGRITRADLPISVPNATTSSDWRVTSVSKPGYFTATPNLAFTIDSNNPVTVGPIRLYQQVNGTLNVHVQDNAAMPLVHSYVKVFDNGDEATTNCSFSAPDTCPLLASGHTNVSGDIANGLTIPVNWASNPTATSRTVIVSIQRVGYKRDLRLVPVQASATVPLTVSLPAATFNIELVPGSSPQSPFGIPQHRIFRPTAIGWYDGYMGRMNVMALNLPGATAIQKLWTWGSTPASIGYIHPSALVTPFDFTGFQAEQPGVGQITVATSFQFNYPGGDYGPAMGLQQYNDNGTFHIEVYPAAPPTLEVNIWGLTIIPPSSTNNQYYAAVSFGGQNFPPDLTYQWELVGCGAVNDPMEPPIIDPPISGGGGPIITEPRTTLPGEDPNGEKEGEDEKADEESRLTPGTNLKGTQGHSSAIVPQGSGSCPATIVGPTNQNHISLTAGSVPDRQVTIRVTVASAQYAQQDSADYLVTIGYSPLNVTMPCQGPPVELAPHQNHPITSQVTGGSGNYAYNWILTDPGNNAVIGMSSQAGNLTGPTGQSYTNFLANVIGTVNVRLVVTDTSSNVNSAPAYCTMNVTPSGGSY